MKITDDLKKFLNSEWGQKMVIEACLIGAESFNYGKKKFKPADLKRYIDGLKLQNNVSSL